MSTIAHETVVAHETVAREAAAVIDEEVTRHLQGLTLRDASPVISALRAQFETDLVVAGQRLQRRPEEGLHLVRLPPTGRI